MDDVAAPILTADQMTIMIRDAIRTYCADQYEIIGELFHQPVTRDRYMGLVRSLTVWPRGPRQVCVSVRGLDIRLWGDLVTSAVIDRATAPTAVEGTIYPFDSTTGSVIFTW